MGRMIIHLPRLGETMEEARVTSWIVAPGTSFKRGDILLEVETDKTVVEVPALQDGVLIEQLVKEGDTVALEAPIAEIESDSVVAPVAKVATATAPIAASLPPVARFMPASNESRPAASPAARAVARHMNVALNTVSGTGRRGRITANDILGNAVSSQKPTVVLLHGLYDDKRGWRDIPERLARAGYDVANMELPGHGNMLPPAQNFEEAVHMITAHIRETLSGKPMIIVGHSLGAALGAGVVAELQKQPENLVARLVMIAPAGVGAHINPDFMAGMLATATRLSLKNCLALLDGGPISDANLDAELIRILKQRPALAALAKSVASDGFQQIDIVPIIDRLKIPVTAIFGLKDQIIDWQASAHLPQAASIHYVRNAGHLPHLAAPEFVLSLISAEAKQHLAA